MYEQVKRTEKPFNKWSKWIEKTLKERHALARQKKRQLMQARGLHSSYLLGTRLTNSKDAEIKWYRK